MDIPVYGLSGLPTYKTAPGLRDLGRCKPLSLGDTDGAASFDAMPGRDFRRRLQYIANPQLRKVLMEQHTDEMRGLGAVFNSKLAKIQQGTATPQDVVDFKKSRILIMLEDSNYNAFKLAKGMMPVVIDITDDGIYLFGDANTAIVAAQAEEQCEKQLTDPTGIYNGLDGWLKNALKKVFVEPVKTVAKTVYKAGEAAVKSTANAAKATFNVVKAGVQAASGNTSAAKETIKKAGNQIKDSVVDPLKTAKDNTVDLVKDTIVQPIKVIFVHLNPLTALIRGGLRMLISVNFLGLASRLAVGMLTEQQAADKGYTKEAWEKAKKALTKCLNIFEKMGGTRSKMEKSIKNGAPKAILNDSNLNKFKTITENAAGDDASLGVEPISIATTVAACASVLLAIWQAVREVVATKKAEKQAEKEQQEYEKKLDDMRKVYANDGYNFITIDGQMVTWEDYEKMKMQQETTDAQDKKKKVAAVGLVALGATIALMSATGNKKQTKKR
jgi:hypothetical protein